MLIKHSNIWCCSTMNTFIGFVRRKHVAKKEIMSLQATWIALQGESTSLAWKQTNKFLWVKVSSVCSALNTTVWFWQQFVCSKKSTEPGEMQQQLWTKWIALKITFGRYFDLLLTAHDKCSHANDASSEHWPCLNLFPLCQNIHSIHLMSDKAKNVLEKSSTLCSWSWG